jgi:hypothetical protein
LAIEDQIPVPQFQGDDVVEGAVSLERRNTGFAVVIPIERIFDIMESDYMRRTLDAEIDKNLKATS